MSSSIVLDRSWKRAAARPLSLAASLRSLDASAIDALYAKQGWETGSIVPFRRVYSKKSSAFSMRPLPWVARQLMSDETGSAARPDGAFSLHILDARFDGREFEALAFALAHDSAILHLTVQATAFDGSSPQARQLAPFSPCPAQIRASPTWLTPFGLGCEDWCRSQSPAAASATGGGRAFSPPLPRARPRPPPLHASTSGTMRCGRRAPARWRQPSGHRCAFPDPSPQGLAPPRVTTVPRLRAAAAEAGRGQQRLWRRAHRGRGSRHRGEHLHRERQHEVVRNREEGCARHGRGVQRPCEPTDPRH